MLAAVMYHGDWARGLAAAIGKLWGFVAGCYQSRQKELLTFANLGEARPQGAAEARNLTITWEVCSL